MSLSVSVFLRANGFLAFIAMAREEHRGIGASGAPLLGVHSMTLAVCVVFAQAQAVCSGPATREGERGGAKWLPGTGLFPHQ
jgi:hypothetical protein